MKTTARTGTRIGVLVPFTNTNLEPDLVLMRPPNCSLHFQRTGGYNADEIPGSDQMAKLGEFDISHDLSRYQVRGQISFFTAVLLQLSPMAQTLTATWPRASN